MEKKEGLIGVHWVQASESFGSGRVLPQLWVLPNAGADGGESRQLSAGGLGERLDRRHVQRVGRAGGVRDGGHHDGAGADESRSVFHHVLLEE